MWAYGVLVTAALSIKTAQAGPVVVTRPDGKLEHDGHWCRPLVENADSQSRSETSLARLFEGGSVLKYGRTNILNCPVPLKRVKLMDGSVFPSFGIAGVNVEPYVGHLGDFAGREFLRGSQLGSPFLIFVEP